MYESAHVFLYLSKKLVQLTISKKEKLILHMIFYRDPNPTEDHIFICGFHDCAFMSLYIIGISFRTDCVVQHDHKLFFLVMHELLEYLCTLYTDIYIYIYIYFVDIIYFFSVLFKWIWHSQIKSFSWFAFQYENSKTVDK